MIDWSKPLDKTDPLVLTEWANDLRARVAKDGVWQCEAYTWILDLCKQADAAIASGGIVQAVELLDRAAHHWYQANK